MAFSMLKIRRPLGRLIFNMGIAIPGKTVFLIETAPWLLVLVYLKKKKKRKTPPPPPQKKKKKKSANINFAFAIISQHWDGAGNWNPSFWKMRTHLHLQGISSHGIDLFWNISVSAPEGLTHWGWVTHLYFGILTIIGSDNGLLPRWCQAII